MQTKARSLHWWISVALVSLGVLTTLALTSQGFRSQELVEHRIWREVLESVSNTYAEQRGVHPTTPVPSDRVLRAWVVTPGRTPPGMPAYLQGLPPGYYSTEGDHGLDAGNERFHALVTPLDEGRLVTVIDISTFEAQQNHDALIHGLWGLAVMVLIAALIIWLHLNLVKPVKDLARRILSIEPEVVGQRLPVTYRQEELRAIASASNAHLERVERFMARERSLLEQASHEFRTPVAVISGAVDLLVQQNLPATANPALRRITVAVETLSETMVALLYLSREKVVPNWQELVAVHDLLPVLLVDHEHLFAGKHIEVRMGTLEPMLIAAPESMVRIAVGNLIRNAIENTADGHVDISLQGGTVCIADSGAGFDPAQAAKQYRESLRGDAPAWGQGLGMFLIGRICERFGWRLSIDSTAGQGTRARLDLSASLVEVED